MNAYQVTVRQARAKDSAALQALYIELTEDNNVRVVPEEVEAAFSDTRTCLIVAEMNEQVCGTVLVSLCSDVMYGSQPFAVVENIVVMNCLRGKGVGARLMEYVDSFCLKSDCTKVMLLSSVSRIEAHAFFEKAGYVGDKKRGFVKYRRDIHSVARNAYNASLDEDVSNTARMSS